MPDLLSSTSLEGRDTGAAQQGLGSGVDERLARVELRRQVARLERDLGRLVGEAFGRIEVDYRVVAAGSPRLLDLGELERLRDDLAERIADARLALRGKAEVETANRELLAQMLAAPAEFKWVRISRADVGEPGCGGWHSRPRLGPLGMLMGWWQVKVSSGCPLAGRLAAVEQEAQAAQEGPAACEADGPTAERTDGLGSGAEAGVTALV
jgi:hypothetical protein